MATFLVGVVLLWPSAARAGTYTVYGTCGLWAPYNNSPAYVAVYPACPELVTRNVGAPSSPSPVSDRGRLGVLRAARDLSRVLHDVRPGLPASTDGKRR